VRSGLVFVALRAARPYRLLPYDLRRTDASISISYTCVCMCVCVYTRGGRVDKITNIVIVSTYNARKIDISCLRLHSRVRVCT